MKYENKNDNLRKLQLVELDGLKYLDKICKENNIEYYLAFGTLLGAVRHKGFIPWDDDIDIAMTGENYLKLLEVMKKNENKKYFFQTLETEKNYYLMWSKLRINNTLFAKEEQLANKINHGIFVDVFPLFEYPDKKDYKRITRKIKMIKLMIENNMTYNYQKKHYGKIGNILSKIIGIIPQKIRNNYAIKNIKKLCEYKSNDKRYYSAFWGVARTYLKENFQGITYLEFEKDKYMVPINYDSNLKEIYNDYMKIPKEEEREVHKDMCLSFDTTKSTKKK